MAPGKAVFPPVPLPPDSGGLGKLPSPPGLVAKVGAYFRRHPVLFLLLLTPGIPEYLSSSTRISSVVLNPAAFLIFFALNAALYTPGALLIREAMVRWKKGWATVLILGVAYGI
ncbi:MAG TPA: hypothetical protein VJS68_04130, partial [Thermoplasmata archaeon]|nr:hypothetical protein [Thermoplasmata archaeon]